MDEKKTYTGVISRDLVGNVVVVCEELTTDFGIDAALLEPCHFFETFAPQGIEPRLDETMQFTAEKRGKYLYVHTIISHNGRMLHDLTASIAPAPVPDPPQIIIP
jgi:hypothetical protein